MINTTMNTTYRCVRICAALGACASAAAAQESKLTAAKAVATQFLNAATQHDWATVVRLTDAASLHDYAARLRKTYRNWSPKTNADVPTVEQYMQMDSTMPRVAAEYSVRKAKEAMSARPPSVLLMLFADVERTEQIDSLTDAELYIRRLRASQLSYQVDLSIRSSKCAVKPGAAIPDVNRTVRGVALLTTRDAVALYEEGGMLDEPGAFVVELHQLPMRGARARWRIVASDQLLGFGNGSSWGFVISTGDCPKPTPR